jgi:hypothetical protein
MKKMNPNSLSLARTPLATSRRVFLLRLAGFVLLWNLPLKPASPPRNLKPIISGRLRVPDWSGNPHPLATTIKELAHKERRPSHALCKLARPVWWEQNNMQPNWINLRRKETTWD